MAIVGHFANLSEAQKLVQSVLLQGVVQEVYEEGQLLRRLPVMTIDSRSVIYNREETLPSAAFYDIHEQIPWTADVAFTAQVEVWLKRVARQDILDKFMMKTYKNPNDYRSIILSQLRKGCMRTIEDNLIYGTGATEASKGFDGLNVLCPPTQGHTFGAGQQDYDNGASTTALPVEVLIRLIEKCKPKPDIILMPPEGRVQIWKYSMGKAGAIVMGRQPNEFGTLVETVNGIPIVISDYLSGNEVDHTGVKSATATGFGSVYAIRFGQIEDGGFCLCTGGDTGGVDFFELTELDALEDYDAGGIRLVAYCAPALGSTKAISRIHSWHVASGVA